LAVQIPGVAYSSILAFVLVATRMGTLFAVAPVLSSKLIPTKIKMVAVLAISFVVMPMATKGQTISTDPATIVGLAAKEAATGLAFALSLACIAAAVNFGAFLIDTVVGFSFASLVDPINNQPQAIFGQVYAMFTSMVFLATGGDQLMLGGIARSYELIPLGQMPSTARMAALATHDLGTIFVIGLEVAAPVVMALFVSDAALAIVSRSVPQMNVFVVGLAPKIILTFAIVAASLPFVANHVENSLQATVMGTLHVLAGR
jgi:flagellar biosynthetic protein FliR